MIEITTWTRGMDTIPAIYGRELYRALSPGRDFSSWISAKIQSFNYQDGEDFTTFIKERGAGAPAKEYLLSLSTAAELCLLDRSDRGRELRRFILDNQPTQKCSCAGNCTADEKPFWMLTEADMKGEVLKEVLKACRKCLAPFTAPGETCPSCQQFEKDQAAKADLVKQRNCPTVTDNELVQCLIEREGCTVLSSPGGAITFQRNEWGHAVARVQNPAYRANLLKSIFYKSYIPPDQEAA